MIFNSKLDLRYSFNIFIHSKWKKLFKIWKRIDTEKLEKTISQISLFSGNSYIFWPNLSRCIEILISFLKFPLFTEFAISFACF